MVKTVADISLGQQRKLSFATSFASTSRSIPSTISLGKYVVGQDITTQGGLVDSILPHTESLEHEKYHWKRANWPARAARNESRLGQTNNSGRIPRPLESDGNSPPLPPEEVKSLRAKSAERPRKDSGLPTLSVDSPTEFQHVSDAQAKQQGLGLDGVVDLSNTTDTDQDVQWAPRMLQVYHARSRLTQDQLFNMKLSNLTSTKLCSTRSTEKFTITRTITDCSLSPILKSFHRGISFLISPARASSRFQLRRCQRTLAMIDNGILWRDKLHQRHRECLVPSLWCQNSSQMDRPYRLKAFSARKPSLNMHQPWQIYRHIVV